MERKELDVYSPYKGVVKYALKTKSDYGNRVYIEYDKCILMFAHLETYYVKEGDIVDIGTVIGKIGNTGYSQQPHLHVSAFNKRSKQLTAENTVDPTFILKLAPIWITNTYVSNGYGSKYCNPKLKKHEGVDVGTKLIPNWEQKFIDPLFVDFRLKTKYPQEYNL